ncbi:hypothetical protein MKK65_08040 [Methylobacterium sp. J-001]|uniref:hypothetical protein n=1 Tax=Methylobacterium sp. J-001 TaxID=2836609 RepID=UPI001FBA6E61|nr:hypothetical protein [Methylobacterium sp. J-001]MCJ2116530.1 hypothetical protein [Methylobacterium sp. J-001]
MITKRRKASTFLAFALTLAVEPLNAQTEEQQRRIEAVQAPFVKCMRRSVDEIYASASDISRSADQILETCRLELGAWRSGVQAMVQQPNPADRHYLEDKAFEERSTRNMIKSMIIYRIAQKRCAAGLPATMLDCASLSRPLIPPRR